jgi:hypothetical protein
MSKQAITVDGRETIVDEDEAKAYRGVHWAWFTLIMMIVLAGLLLLGGVLKLNIGGDSNPNPERPGSETTK